MYKDKDKERAYQRKYILARYHRWRAIGACGFCGEPCAPFALCFKHRVRKAKYEKRRRLNNGKKSSIRAITKGYERDSPKEE